MNTGTLRVLLGVDIIIMALLAIAYLSQRRLEWRDFCAWGMLAVFVPLLGPFVVILCRPGAWRTPPAADFPSFSPAGLRELSDRAILAVKSRRARHRTPINVDTE